MESAERQLRFKNYLNLFRNESSVTGIPQQRTIRRGTLSNRYSSYSEDESDEDIEEISPSKLRKVQNYLSPSKWVSRINLDIFKSNTKKDDDTAHHSTARSYSGYRGSTGVGFHNGNSRRDQNLIMKTKKYFGDMFEQTGNGSRRENENIPDGSSNISRYLLLTVIGFFLVLGLCYFNQIKGNRKSGLTGPTVGTGLSSTSTASYGGNYPICGVADVLNTACVNKEQVKTCRTLFRQLKVELVKRSKWKGCTDFEDVTLENAKNMLYHLSDLKKDEVGEAYRGMLILCTENPKWGLHIHESGDKRNLLSSNELNFVDFREAIISAADITPYIFCRLWFGISLVLSYITMLIASAFVIYLIVTVGKYVHGRRRRKEEEVFQLVDQILDILYQQYEKSQETGCEAFLAVNHIRDEMVPPKEKKNKAALWNNAVQYISDNESRIREEIQHISGEEFKVWRWLPGASPLTSQRKSMLATNNLAHLPNLTSTNTENKWQGQAFEMSDGGPNSTPITPTTCLKIRHMWDVNSGSPDQVLGKVEQAILEKCTASAILHIGIDPVSPDGCVYVRCASKEDARTAYVDLHGWWFDGHLLSVKFLRHERYFTRFPNAKDRNTRMQLSSPSVTMTNQFVEPVGNNLNLAHRSRNR